MTHRIIITSRALQDLTEIRDYIAKRSPSSAAGFLHKLLGKFDVLELSPDGYGLAPEDDLVPYALNQVIVKPYRILYRVSESPRGNTAHSPRSKTASPTGRIDISLLASHQSRR